MMAAPEILELKYTGVIRAFAESAGLSLDDALRFFYASSTYDLMSNGISDMHCMSDAYLAEDLIREYRHANNKRVQSNF